MKTIAIGSGMLITLSISALISFGFVGTGIAQEPDLYTASKFESDTTANDYVPPFAPLAGTKDTRGCIGEKVCPVSANAMFPCGYTEERAGNEICTVYKGDGKKVILDHSLVHQGTHEGNACGYSWFLVTCYLP